MIDNIIKNAINKNASDIHITVNCFPAFRIYGEIFIMNEELKIQKEDIELFLKKTGGNLEKFYKKKIFDTSFTIFNTNLRCHFYLSQEQVTVSIRIIPSIIPKLDDLNLPKSVNQCCTYRKGLILVTGATSSGKSTTLASIINEINKTKTYHIVTIEDPIEFVFKNNKSIIHQKEFGKDFDTYPEAMKAALRENPDILLVGELRDEETIAAALSMAESGILVLSTLHTKNASESIERIVNMFPSGKYSQVRMQLALTLKAVISQILVPSTVGRIPLCEVMFSNNAIKTAIREGKNMNTIIDSMFVNKSIDGSQTFSQSAVDLISNNFVLKSDVEEYIEDKSQFEKLLAISSKKK